MGIPAFFRTAGGPILVVIALNVATNTLSAGWIIACIPLAITLYRSVALRRTDPEGGSGPS
ncbi:MAG: hypothetical protein IPG46_19765 [Actinobacteria bacterium]|nr:hypothetical protein [Actinomycetota bacterium]